MQLTDELPPLPSNKGLRGTLLRIGFFVARTDGHTAHQRSTLAAAAKDIPSLVWWLNVDVPASTPDVLSWLLELGKLSRTTPTFLF